MRGEVVDVPPAGLPPGTVLRHRVEKLLGRYARALRRHGQVVDELPVGVDAAAGLLEYSAERRRVDAELQRLVRDNL